jgi:hypothetical protein
MHTPQYDPSVMPIVSADIGTDDDGASWTYFEGAAPSALPAASVATALALLLDKHLTDHPDYRLALVLSPDAARQLAAALAA